MVVQGVVVLKKSTTRAIAFAFCSLTIHSFMNRRPHRILTLAHRLGDTCSLCHMYIEPRDILRVDWDYCVCPHCKGIYALSPPRWSTQAAVPIEADAPTTKPLPPCSGRALNPNGS